jgi:hypothetical protein
MRSTQLTTIVAGAVLAAGIAGMAYAQTVDTRIGKLELQNGYPSQATVDTLYDEMDFQRATQAFIWALPAVGFHGLHRAQRDTFGAKDGDVVLYQDLKDKAGMLTPNLTTLYLMTFWNLAEQGPMVVEVPAGATAGGFLDIWQRPITDTGQTGPDRGGGAKYLIVPPGSDIREMDGYIVAQSPSNQVWFAARALDRDPKVAEEIARKHKVYGWNQRSNPPPTKFVPVGGKEWSSAQPVGLDYWRYLSEVIQPEPIEPRDKVMLGMLAPLGIGKGKPFNPDERQKKILTDAAQLGELMARTNAFDKRFPMRPCGPARNGNTPTWSSSTRRTTTTRRSTSAGRGSTRRSATRSACRAAPSTSGKSIWRPPRTRMATGWTAARRTACACRPIRRSYSSGRSRSTTTPRAARW